MRCGFESAWRSRALIAGLVTLAVAAITQAGRAQQPSRPNVVVILTDDQRHDMLSCAGHPFLKTPRIDQLAREGVRYANAFVTTSLCSPSRASFLSSRYAHSHGVISNFTDFPAELASYPKLLHAAGYTTAYIGKWHMGEDDDSPRPGFDYWVSHTGQGQYNDTEFNVNGQRRVVPGYYTTVVTDMACAYLDQTIGGDKPFCLIIGHKAPHTPYTPEPRYQNTFPLIELDYPHSAYSLEEKPEWIRQRLDTWHGIYGPLYGFREKFPNRDAAAVLQFEAFGKAYAATVLSIDDAVGRVYDTLWKAGALDNTLLVFASDNGMFLGEHGMTDKRAMHEPSIRIPLVARYPARLPVGHVEEAMVLNLDLAPTVLELCGCPPMQGAQGRSLVSLAEGKRNDWRTSFLYEYNYEKQFPYTPNVRGIRTDRWKYMHYPHGDGSPDRHMAELYDLASDPGERHNLINDPAAAGVRDQLAAELERLLAQTGGLPDRMPLDEGIQAELPDASVR